MRVNVFRQFRFSNLYKPQGEPVVNHLAPEFFLNFSTPCISNVNITGTEKGSIMK
jgi:hypothetical protein